MREINFFDFGDADSPGTIQVESVGLKSIPNEKEDDHYDLMKGKYLGIEFPVIFKQKYGKKLQDILGTGWVSFYLISEKLRMILEENNFTGWKAFPVIVYGKNNEMIPNYHGFSITGKSGPFCYENSEIVERSFVPRGKVVRCVRGSDIIGWDGSHFFIPEKSRSIVTTKEVVVAFNKSKLTNIRFENLSTCEIEEWILGDGYKRN